MVWGEMGRPPAPRRLWRATGEVTVEEGRGGGVTLSRMRGRTRFKSWEPRGGEGVV